MKPTIYEICHPLVMETPSYSYGGCGTTTSSLSPGSGSANIGGGGGGGSSSGAGSMGNALQPPPSVHNRGGKL